MIHIRIRNGACTSERGEGRTVLVYWETPGVGCPLFKGKVSLPQNPEAKGLAGRV